MAINVSPDISRPTHHIKLSRSGVEVGLILCDGQGRATERAIGRAPYPRSALKMYTGEHKYSDMEPPFRPVVQQDWSGGRGQEDFDDDQTRYFDGFRMDTTKKGRLILGGQETYCKGYRSQDIFLPGKVTWRSLTGVARYRAASFSASATYNAVRIEQWVRKVGSPGTLTVELRSNSGSDPGSVLKTATATAGDFADILSVFHAFAFSAQSLTAGTTYWVVIYGAAGDDATNHWNVACDADSNGKQSSDGSTWSTHSKPYFRVTDADATFKAHFYEYRGALYFATQPDAGTAGKVYQNGYIGTDGSSDKDKITDTSKAWATNELAGAVAEFVAGAGFDQDPAWRSIISNTATVATVSPAFDIAGVVSGYVILGLNSFQELSGTGSLGPFKGVAVANDIVYLTQGEVDAIIKHRNIGHGALYQWANGGTLAEHINVLHDPQAGPTIYWSRNERDNNFSAELFAENAPPGWSSEHLGGRIQLMAPNAHWDEQAISNVTNTFINNVAQTQIKTGVITGVGITDAGTGYVVNNILNVIQTGATGGQVKVTSVGGSGEVTGITLETAGTGYTTGAGKATEYPGGSGPGSGLTVNVTSITGFGTGVIGSKAIAGGKDLRYSNKIHMQIKSSIDMDSGDLQFLLDDTADCASPVITVNFPSMSANTWYWLEDLDYDAMNVAGSEKIISIGLNLTASKESTDVNGVTTIEVQRGVYANKDQGPIQVGENGAKITGLEIYGDPETVVVFTESQVGEIRDHQFKPKPIREMGAVRSSHNGRGHCVADVFLYFSLQDGFQRYYRQNLDDIGPNREAGLPDERQGPIVSAVSYPGRIYAAVDGGNVNYSSVLCYDERGWYEVYRAPRRGLRIRSIYIQSIPGRFSSRLWINQGADVLWVPVSLNPQNDSTYRYNHEAAIITSRIYAGMNEIDKFWKSVKLVTRKLSSYEGTIEVEYRVDDTDSWTAITSIFDTSPSQEKDISSDHSVKGKFIQLRLIVRTIDNTVTPEITALVVESLMRIPVKYAYTVTFRVADKDVDLNGDPDPGGGKTKLDQLNTWIGSALPITLNSISDIENGAIVYPEPVPLKRLKVVTLEDGREAQICEMTLIEI